MTDLTRKILWVALFLALILSAVLGHFPLEDASKRVKMLSSDGLGYASREIPLTVSEEAIYGKASVIKRGYQLGVFSRFVLIVVDGTKNRHAIHDPLYCFKGSGWNILVNKRVIIEGGKARFLRLSKEGKMKETIFWFSDGSIRYDSIFIYWLQTTLRRLTLGLSGKEPVMVILQPFGNDALDWQRVMEQFGPLSEL